MNKGQSISGRLVFKANDKFRLDTRAHFYVYTFVYMHMFMYTDTLKRINIVMCVYRIIFTLILLYYVSIFILHYTMCDAIFTVTTSRLWPSWTAPLSPLRMSASCTTRCTTTYKRLVRKGKLAENRGKLRGK